MRFNMSPAELKTQYDDFIAVAEINSITNHIYGQQGQLKLYIDTMYGPHGETNKKWTKTDTFTLMKLVESRVSDTNVTLKEQANEIFGLLENPIDNTTLHPIFPRSYASVCMKLGVAHQLLRIVNEETKFTVEEYAEIVADMEAEHIEKVTELEKKYDTKKEECDAKNDECTEIKKQFDTKKEEYDAKKEEYDVKKNECTEIKKQFDAKNDECTELKTKNETLQINNHTHLRMMLEHTKNRKRAREEHDNYNNTIKTIKKQLEESKYIGAPIFVVEGVSQSALVKKLT